MITLMCNFRRTFSFSKQCFEENQITKERFFTIKNTATSKVIRLALNFSKNSKGFEFKPRDTRENAKVKTSKKATNVQLISLRLYLSKNLMKAIDLPSTSFINSFANLTLFFSFFIYRLKIWINNKSKNAKLSRFDL